MLDNRVYTFLKLCELMNYRRTAEALNMTQPAVTQHIHVLEREYGCPLFHYDGRALYKTDQCMELERHLRAEVYNERAFREQLERPAATRLAVGATKTIGDYTIEKKVLELLGRKNVELELIIDNTINLLAKLNAMELDFLLVEGFVDKENYGTSLIKEEELTGICAMDHPFAGRSVPLEELFQEHIILRESGSGTRAVFEEFLYERGYNVSRFRRRSVISSFKLIEKAVSNGMGVSFVYESIPRSNETLATFRIKGARISHEFNFVFLKNSSVEEKLAQLRD